GLCPVCNQPDSIHHRLYKCEGSAEIKNAREAVQATDFFFQQAREGAQEFFTGLKFRHPSTSWPQPSDEHEPALFDAEGAPMDWGAFNTEGLSVSGDGSCVPHMIKELSRASYAWVFMGADGQP
ncbi:unnamed protein product, partial [Prorocentrum cordatum]